MERLRVVERNLLLLVLAAVAVGLALPGVGVALSGVVSPLLAVLMFAVSLTFDAGQVHAAARRPVLHVTATTLVYGPMALIGALLGRLLFGATTPYGLGQTLVGVLPTDVSAPLLVYLARGNVALATLLNAINTSLAPVLVPLLFVALTGVTLDVPVVGLMAELALVIIVPAVVGVWLRTRFADRIAPNEPVASTIGSLAYLALLLAVIGPNADTLLAAGTDLVLLIAGALLLNVTGYALAMTVRPWVRAPADRAALLFTVSKKEFGIAAVVVAASGLPAQVAVPAAVFAVVQMITSPLAARWLSGRANA